MRRNGRHVRALRVKIDCVDRIGLCEARNCAKAIMSQFQSGVDACRHAEADADDATTPCSTGKSWRHDSNETAPGKPGAVHHPGDDRFRRVLRFRNSLPLPGSRTHREGGFDCTACENR